MGDGTHEDGHATLAADAPCYTVVKTTYGYLYVVLIPNMAKLLYDARTLSRTAAEAEAALRAALAAGAGEEPLAPPCFVPPAELLARLMAALVQAERT